MSSTRPVARNLARCLPGSDDKRSAIATLARKQNFKMKQIITRLEPREDKPIPNTPQGGY